MMRLWSQNATFTAGPGKTATGKQQIQQFWLNSEAFKPSTEWVGPPGVQAAGYGRR